MSTTSARRAPRNSVARPAPQRAAASLDLDTLEREGEVVPPLSVTVGGEEFVFPDIEDMDWHEAYEVSQADPISLVKALLGEDEFKRFSVHRLPLWKLNALADRLDKHFGWSVKLSAMGEDNASSTS